MSTQPILFTCLSCSVGFQSSDGQRSHMKSDWHRYNLKRKVVALPPISASLFSQKVLESQVVVEEFDGSCKPCRKTFASKGAFETHVKSKKHLEAVKDLDSQELSDATSITTRSEIGSQTTEGSKVQTIKVRLGQAQTEREVDEILNEKMESATRLTCLDCLFCPCVSVDNMANLEHMAKSHSFFLPDFEWLVDLEGLLQYLADKISVANVCIYCSGKGRAMHSLEAVRAHMVGKGHCKILYQDGNEDEIAEFYKFGNDEDWEDKSSGSGESESDDEDSEEGYSLNLPSAAYEDGADLVLPSGLRIGHRSFRRYWSQNLRPIAIVPGSMRDPAMVSRLTSDYRLMGYGGGSTAMTIAERREKKVAKKETLRSLKKEQTHTARIGYKHNMLQHHYREQNPF